jgi:hypothetical protein
VRGGTSYAFDLLEFDGTDLRREPIETRKATLASLLRGSLPGFALNEHLTHPGDVVFQHACKMGLEGIVSKRLGSRYRSSRTPDWLKFKNPEAPGGEAGGGRRLGQRGVAVTGAKICANASRCTMLTVAALTLSGCTQDEATARLKGDLQVDRLEIIHARFPCRSPDTNLFGYRFRIWVKEEYAYGDICWDVVARSWTWQILPEYRLSRLNLRK